MPGAVIGGFAPGDIIDLTAVPFSQTGNAALKSNNVLETAENGQVYDLQLDPSQTFHGYFFDLASDGNGGTQVTVSRGNGPPPKGVVIPELLDRVAEASYSTNATVPGLVAVTSSEIGNGINLTNGLYSNNRSVALLLQGTINGQKSLVIAFRGSSTAADWIQDLQGVDQHYNFTQLVSAIQSLAGNYDVVYLTGHSLGGAMAQLALNNLEQTSSDPTKFQAITFGSPGTQEVIPNYAQQTNYQIADDPVPFLGQNRFAIGAAWQVWSGFVDSQDFATRLVLNQISDLINGEIASLFNGALIEKSSLITPDEVNQSWPYLLSGNYDIAGTTSVLGGATPLSTLLSSLSLDAVFSSLEERFPALSGVLQFADQALSLASEPIQNAMKILGGILRKFNVSEHYLSVYDSALGGNDVNTLVSGSGSGNLVGWAGTNVFDINSSFTGTISGLKGNDSIDFTDFSFSNGVTLGYSANSGILTATGHGHSAEATLLGQYTASSFVPSSDGHGGTLVTDTPLAPSSQTLALSQHP
jgi:hypothetical protein